jgi:hypothetical protein
MLADGAPIELVADRHLLEHERRGWVLDPEELLKPRARA